MNRTIHTVGFWSALLALVFIVAYITAQLLQLAHVLPSPLDGILIFGTSQGIVIPFLLAVLALHHSTLPTKQFWTHASLVFAIMYAVFVSANYTVQLATVIPIKLRDATAKVPVLDQTPHSMFWDFDALGYICMGLTTLAAAPVFNRVGLQKWVRRTFLANALVTPLISVVYFSPSFSEQLLVIAYPWAITAPLSMLLLALLFRKMKDNEKIGEKELELSMPF